MSQSSATAKVQWWIFGLLLLVHVAVNVNPNWVVDTVIGPEITSRRYEYSWEVDSVIGPQDVTSRRYKYSWQEALFAGWPFDCTGDTYSQRRPIYLLPQIIANFAIAICSSWGASACASPAIVYCYLRFRWRAIAALAATIIPLICFPSNLELPLSLPSKLIYRVNDLLNCVTWSVAILGVYWHLSHIVSAVKRFNRLKDGQFNLSMVLIGVTASSILFAFAASQFRSQQAQKQAIAYFNRYGYILKNEANYYDDSSWGVIVPMPGKIWRDWEAATGVSRYLLASSDGLYRVVDFGDSGEGEIESEVDWSYLRSLPYLQMIEINANSQNSGEMLAELAKCERLTCIVMNHCAIQDDDLKVLTGDSKLKQLHLYGAPITDRSVGYLIKLKNLRVLNITGTKISKEGEQQLKEGLPRCNVWRYDQQDHEVVEDPSGE